MASRGLSARPQSPQTPMETSLVWPICSRAWWYTVFSEQHFLLYGCTEIEHRRSGPQFPSLVERNCGSSFKLCTESVSVNELSLPSGRGGEGCFSGQHGET